MTVKELNSFDSQRLLMRGMQSSDFAFMNALLNSEGFLKFVGDRNIRSDEDAKAYVEKTLGNENIRYWIVSAKDNPEPMGIVSFVKRDYLPIPDVGYSFLPGYTGKGFALEATYVLMQKLFFDCKMDELLAIPNKLNSRSVNLLEKLCFVHQREMERDGKVLHVYGITKDEFSRQMSKIESKLLQE